MTAVNTFFSSIDFGEAQQRELIPVSWDLFPKFASAYSLLQYSQIDSDDHFMHYGFKQGAIEEELNLEIIKAFQAAKATPFFLEDCDPNYLSSGLSIDTQEALNVDHTYLMLEDVQKEALQPVLFSLKEAISSCLGSAWRVVSLRSWETDSTARAWGPNAWHSDGMPTSVYKIMYYPFGADYELGTVELRLPEGAHALNGPPGTWMLFKNSEVTHRGVSTQNISN